MDKNKLDSIKIYKNFNKTKGLKSLNHGHTTAEVLATNTSTNDKTGTKWMPNDGTWSENT